jgi:hypothetical protein
MMAVEGGTQALRRTVNARLKIEPGQVTTVCSQPYAVVGLTSTPRRMVSVALSGRNVLKTIRRRNGFRATTSWMPAIDGPQGFHVCQVKEFIFA